MNWHHVTLCTALCIDGYIGWQNMKAVTSTTGNHRNWLTNPMQQSHPGKLKGSQKVQKFPVFHGTLRFIAAFTSARHLSLSSATAIQSVPPHSTFWRFTLILPFHLHLRLPGGLSPPQVSPSKPFMQLARPPYVPHILPISFFWFDHPNDTWWMGWLFVIRNPLPCSPFWWTTNTATAVISCPVYNVNSRYQVTCRCWTSKMLIDRWHWVSSICKSSAQL